MIDEVIPSALDGERLDRIVAMVAGVTRAVASDTVNAGAVLLDGQVCTVGRQRVHAGQRLQMEPPVVSDSSSPQADPLVPVEVIYDDDDVIVVNKSAGLVVHPGAGNPDGTLVNGLLATYPELAGVGESHRPGIVHRLDAGTSGLLVVARSAVAYQRLVSALSSRLVRRGYQTLVWGHPATSNGIIDAPIGRDRRDPQRMAVTADGKPARTHYRVERRFVDPVEVALLDCQLETGRTHQIRVHVAAIGHPVVGDATYGGVRPGLSSRRPFLHAAELAFEHPTTGQSLTFTTPLPADLVDVLAAVSERPAE